MKFFTVIATLAALAAAAPSPAAENLNAVEITTESSNLVARQTFPGCGMRKPGEYSCYANISNPNDRYQYVGQCGLDGNTHVSNY